MQCARVIIKVSKQQFICINIVKFCHIIVYKIVIIQIIFSFEISLFINLKIKLIYQFFTVKNFRYDVTDSGVNLMATEERWYFTKEQIQNTPSRRCGIDAEKELSYRQQSANLIQDMGQRLQL